jgi:hypothetical protein
LCVAPLRERKDTVIMVERLEKGVLGAVGHAIGAVLRNGLVGLVIGVVLGEAGGAALDKSSFSFPGGTFVQVASIAFGIALAFGFAMTTALAETIKGLVDAARALEGDASKAVGAGLGDIGHEAGAIVQSVEHKN